MSKAFNFVLEDGKCFIDCYRSTPPKGTFHVDRDLTNLDILNRLKMVNRLGKSDYLVDFINTGVAYTNEVLRSSDYISVEELLRIIPNDDSFFIISEYGLYSSISWTLQGIYIDDASRKVYLVPSYIKGKPLHTGLAIL